jgi:hypothetical protein
VFEVVVRGGLGYLFQIVGNVGVTVEVQSLFVIVVVVWPYIPAEGVVIQSVAFVVIEFVVAIDVGVDAPFGYVGNLHS